MPALDSKLRSTLDTVCQTARDLAVTYARLALQKRGVDAPEALPHFGPAERDLRNRLRARGRQVGDVRTADGKQSIDQLTQELAYEFWHRMLFARFLAENDLLMHPDGVAVSLEECEELAASADPPAANGFVLAARYASAMLPQIFRTDDVLLEIDFAPEQRLALEKLLASLPKETFLADDSLGWVYQFWQTAEKQRVNESGDKIDGRTLPAVTQLFTEHYMVEFLLHNTIGAWWCAKEGIQGPPGGAGIPAGKCPVDMLYLRWKEDGTPAAGKFEGWPSTLAEFTTLDPCCGSGHFLVAAFNLLVPLRMNDEGLTADKACDAVLRENLFGLELDARCTQIAAFALAFAAWKYPDTGGYRTLPPLNIASSGQGIAGKKDEWLSLATGDHKLRNGIERLYDLFQQASHLGSLIDPSRDNGSMFEAGYTELQPLLMKALAKTVGDADLTTIGVVAQGVAKAAEFLSRKFTLVVTNVPFLGYREMDGIVLSHVGSTFPEERGDLGYCLWKRFHNFVIPGCTIALVTLQHWLSLRSYTAMRKSLLSQFSILGIAHLGARAFETISGEKVNVCLTIATKSTDPMACDIAMFDAAYCETPKDKAQFLRKGAVYCTSQKRQYANPDHRISFGDLSALPMFSDYVDCLAGIMNGDSPKFIRCFWELPEKGRLWVYLQSTVSQGTQIGGLERVIFFDEEAGHLREDAKIRRLKLHNADERGNTVWGRPGVAISQMSSLPASRYFGNKYDSNVAAIVPKRSEHLPAVWAFCTSDEFHDTVRAIDRKLNVTNATFGKIPFDLARWQVIAAKQYPNGLPEPHSDDPTQWLFRGEIATSTDPLQVAVARLLGFRWPEHASDKDFGNKLSDDDGIVCLAGVRGEVAAAERLLDVLWAAFGHNWSDSVLHRLLTNAGCVAGPNLDDWLRSLFFEQHCNRFNNRPFIWHIWDGRKDGFSALVNYHKLDHKALENLTYSYLGDWIKAQSRSDKAGADSRLGAAQALQEKLKLILEGEPPYDIFVRWKPLHEQPIGWNPDLNDGVRMNIRPFVTAGILRKTPNIKWTKDRGKEPLRDKADYPWFWSGDTFVGDRVNDIHLTHAEKEAARKRRRGAS
ncbi:MAG: DNA methyltransferase [Planctomycetaceae bacterium]|jgi:hypothetical protein